MPSQGDSALKDLPFLGESIRTFLQFKLPIKISRTDKLNLTSLHKIISFAVTFSYICFKNKLNIPTFVTGILAGLVSITGNKFAMTFAANIFPSC